MKTLLVDDHALFLEGLRKFLAVNGFEVVGTARNGAEALMQFEILKPDLILMDIQMADFDGIQTTRMIKKEYPGAKIVMLTAVEDYDSLFAAIEAGAEGYLVKDMEPESFIRQLVGLTEGETPLAPGLTQHLLQEFSRHKKKDNKAASGIRRKLTERQMELLQLLAEGLTYKEIALRLDLKEVTVKYHVKEILAKLRLTNRAQLIVYATRQLAEEEQDNL